MRNLSMKTLFGMFFILLFVLSPLSAAGLNQGHDNNHADVNNGTSMKNCIKGMNNPLKNMSTYKTKNNTKNQLSWRWPWEDTADIFVDDVDCGQQPIVHWKWNHPNTGRTDPSVWVFNVIVTGVDPENKNYCKIYIVHPYDRDVWNSLKLDEDLMPGKYKATIKEWFNGNPNNYTYFVVRKLDIVDDMKPRIEINSENKPVFNFTRPKTKYDLTGNVTIYSSHLSKQYVIPIPKYEGRINYIVNETVKPDPDIDYWVRADYSGNIIYKGWRIFFRVKYK